MEDVWNATSDVIGIRPAAAPRRPETPGAARLGAPYLHRPRSGCRVPGASYTSVLFS